MDKHYDPKEIEARWYPRWEALGAFRGDPGREGEPYSIVIPPPNVTGILHMGHALNNTVQDILTRWQRMAGRNAVWIPGMDHASIATETKVVRQLAEQGIRKEDLTRETFLAHAWEWKEKYGGIIINQLRRMGCSCDWDRLAFTMDEAYSRAVLTAFVRLYDKGYVYRGHRLVNWCPASRSAISDEEVMHREVNGKLWHFRYPVADSGETVVVATTRPETMLGDTAVAVHPGDKRYAGLVGRQVMLPLVGRAIPIIADERVDPEFGTGCVKVTPGHDPNDFEMGQRHALACISIMNEDASLNDRVPDVYRGLSREAARKRVVADLDALGLLDKVQAHRHQVGYSQRGDVPIEYFLSEQWFMRMDALAGPAIAAVQDGRIRIHPGHWVKTYQHWMANIRDWCISRQLWWGHRIPVWYRKGADRGDPAARHVSVDGPPDPENWEQDEDVLDTWASSWLWPFAVHGWPEPSEALARYYPTASLSTAPDILFFWVARMIMAGLEFMGDVPFRDVYIHGIVRDDVGKKMSKSLGNMIDPIEIIDQYSADALRFSLIMLTATGQDVYVASEKFELGRNFGTKLWNAARFMVMQAEKAGRNPGRELGAYGNPVSDPTRLRSDDKHILARLDATIRDCTDNLESFRFNDAAHTLYEFVWHRFCDWYVEYAKEALYGEDTERRDQVLNLMAYVFGHALRLLHPFMPFITEELWHTMGYAERDDDLIMRAGWPEPLGEACLARWDVRADAVEYVEDKHELIRAGRLLRADYGVLPTRHVEFLIKPRDAATGERLEQDGPTIAAMLKAEPLVIDAALKPPKATPSGISRLGTIYMPLQGVIDVAEERARLTAQLAKVERDLERAAAKLENASFVKKAPAEVVERQREQRDALLESHRKLDRLIATLTEADDREVESRGA